jgi:hypothetical protein
MVQKKKKIILFIIIFFLVFCFFGALALIFKNTLLSKTVGIKYLGAKSEFIEATNTADTMEVVEDTPENSESFSSTLPSQQVDLESGKILCDVQEILLSWEYFPNPYSEEKISGQAKLTCMELQGMFSGIDKKNLVVQINDDIINKLLNDIIQKSEPDWYAEIQGAFSVFIKDKSIWIQTDFTHTTYNGWMKILNGSSIVLDVLHDNKAPLQFKAFIMGNAVYSLEKDSSFSQGVDTVVTGANKTLKSIELTVNNKKYHVVNIEPQGSVIFLTCSSDE